MSALEAVKNIMRQHELSAELIVKVSQHYRRCFNQIEVHYSTLCLQHEVCLTTAALYHTFAMQELTSLVEGQPLTPVMYEVSIKETERRYAALLERRLDQLDAALDRISWTFEWFYEEEQRFTSTFSSRQKDAFKKHLDTMVDIGELGKQVKLEKGAMEWNSNCGHSGSRLIGLSVLPGKVLD